MMTDKSTTGRRGGIIGRAVADSRAQPSETPQQVAPTSKDALFASVKRARGQIAALGVVDIIDAAKKVSETTRAQYDRINKRRLSGGVVDLAGLSRASWYPAKAALQNGLAARVQAAMRGQDKAQRGGDYDLAAKFVKIAEQALEQLEAVQSAKAPKPEKVQRSARQRLPKASGASWQAKVHDVATETMKPAVAVMWATGARPAEVEKGIDIQRSAKGIVVRIPGAKVNDAKQSGQPVRIILVAADTPAGRALSAALGDEARITVQRKAARIGKDFADHIRPRLPASYKVTAYSFRHQVAANLKAENGPENASATATTLGHRSTRSQQSYGKAQQSQGGGSAILAAKATHQPKETRGIVKHPPSPSARPNGPSMG